MFDRVRIKEMAKTALKRSHWMVVLAVLIASLLGGAFAHHMQATVNLNIDLPFLSDTDVDVDDPDDDFYRPDNGNWQDGYNGWEDGNGNYGNPWYDTQPQEAPFSLDSLWEEFAATLGVALPILIVIFAVVLILAIVIGSLMAIFVSNVMTVGIQGWLLRYWRGETAPIGEVFASFRLYKPAVITMLVRSIYTFLWSLLFVIPGIVKSYAYSMVPYIIYENPNISANRAIAISKKMTDGYKGDLFVLSLSFIGWHMLSSLTGGLVGFLYAYPYMGVTYAGAYEDLKWKAIQSGKLTWEDFGQQPPAAADPYADSWTAAPDSEPAPEWHNPSQIW